MNAKVEDTGASAPAESGRAAALKNNAAAAAEAEVKSLSVERQRDILLEAVQAYTGRHSDNVKITDDPMYSGLVSAASVVQRAKA